MLTWGKRGSNHGREIGRKKQKDQPSGRVNIFFPKQLRNCFPFNLVSLSGRRDGDLQRLHFSEKLDSRMRMEAGRLPTLTVEEPGQEPPGTLPVLYPVLVSLSCGNKYHGLPRWLSGKESACQCRRRGFDPWARKIPWRRKWQTPSTILAWKTPWTEAPGRLQSMGWQSWTWLTEYTHMHTQQIPWTEWL